MRKWLITGVSGGLGQAMADHIKQSGEYVIGTVRREDQASAFNERHAGKGEAVVLDLNNIEEAGRTVSGILDTHQIDVLVNNAGVGFTGAVEEASIAEVRQVMEVNFFAALRLTQLVLPFMRGRRSGHIVQISSHGGLKAFAGFGVYNASKFAMEGFSEALAQEVAPLGIQVLIVEPGPFRTNFAGKGLAEAEEVINDYAGSAGAFRSMIRSVDGRQEGDPAKAARAIYEAVSGKVDYLRLPLGKTALKTIRMKLDSVASDLEANRNTAEDAVVA